MKDGSACTQIPGVPVPVPVPVPRPRQRSQVYRNEDSRWVSHQSISAEGHADRSLGFPLPTEPYQKFNASSRTFLTIFRFGLGGLPIEARGALLGTEHMSEDTGAKLDTLRSSPSTQTPASLQSLVGGAACIAITFAHIGAVLR